MTIAFAGVTPVLRIFNVAKADEFYLEFLGFSADWDHRFGDNAPLYRQISRNGLILHLSEHHGDGSPGVRIRIATRDVAALQRDLIAKRYRYMGPGLEETPWRTRECTVIDPFGNHLVFYETIDQASSDAMPGN